MKYLNTGTLIFMLFTLTVVNGQNISEKSCKEVFELAKDKLNITKIYSSEVYDTDCLLGFTTNDKTSVLISIEKYISDKESQAEIKRQWEETLELDELTRLNPNNKCESEKPSDKKIDLANWNEAYISKSKGDNVLLLRRDNFVINIFSNTTFDILSVIEKRINRIKLE